MKKYAVFVVIMALSMQWVAAQNFELGGQVGVSVYSGDLTPKEFSGNLNQSHMMFGAQVRYNPNPYLSFGLEFNNATISGNDKYNTNPKLIERNLNFESGIQELSLNFEYNIFGLDLEYGSKSFSPFLKAGIGGFHFNPITYYNGEWVNLQPLGTEGQGTSEFPDREKYSLYQIALPFGGGLKLRLSDNIALAVEFSWRFTFTDYLDDVSTTYPSQDILSEENGTLAAQLSWRTDEFYNTDSYAPTNGIRGGSDINDYYFFGHVGIRYIMQDGNGIFKNSRRRSRIKCPTF